MIDSNAFAKMVPGMDFLQNLMQGGGAAVPSMGSWIAPTLDPKELDKRIGELKTVHFWLEQNARMVAATIQALEVQRMTLGALQSMNLPMADLRQAMTLPEADTAPKPRARPKVGPRGEEATAGPPPVDPMQWWSALTRQFSELAAKAVQDSSAIAAHGLAAAAPSKDEPAPATPRKTTRRARAPRP